MSVITILELPGVDEAAYGRIAARLQSAGAPAQGIEFHSCGPGADGWTIVDVWESEAAWRAFLDERYLPAARPELTSPQRATAIPATHAGAVQR